MAPVKKPPHVRRKHFLWEWRKHSGLSQEDAADRLEIDRSSISKYENGEVPYNQDLLERMAVIYGCEPADLLSVEPPGHEMTGLLKSASAEQLRIIAAVLHIDNEPSARAPLPKPIKVSRTSKDRSAARRGG